MKGLNKPVHRTLILLIWHRVDTDCSVRADDRRICGPDDSPLLDVGPSRGSKNVETVCGEYVTRGNRRVG
jgi:hypothetical protein